MMKPSSIRMGVLNRELGSTSIDQARSLIQSGFMRWVLGPLATLRIENVDYKLQAGETFVEEVEENYFVPAQ